MSLQQRRKKAADRLKADPQQTDVQIGLAVGLSDKTVASVRAELVARSEIPSVDERVDSRKRRTSGRKPRGDPPRGMKNAAQMILDAEKTAPPLAPETEKPDPVEAEQPEPQAERPVAPATDTVPTAPTDTADDEMESDEEDLELEPTAEETLTNAIESVELLLDKLFDEEIIYRLAEVDLDKRDALLSRLRAGLNRRVDAIERAPVLDKADAIAALPESVKAYFRMHGRVSNCDVRWYINRFPALNKLEDSERRAIADKLIRDMLQCGELIKVKCNRDVYEIATEIAPSAVEEAKDELTLRDDACGQ
jgi:RNA-binding protein YhbY